MAHSNATHTLAAALSAAQRKEDDSRNPLVDKLATALAIPQPNLPEDDDADEDLDLPMLVQGNRTLAVVPSLPTQRVREGRAALIGFGLGMVLLVPLGVVMSSRVPDHSTPSVDVATSSLSQGFMPTMVVTDEAGIRTTRRPTQALTTPAAIVIEEPAPAPVQPMPETKPVLSAPEAKPVLAAPAPPPVAPAPPPPDLLEQARVLVGKGDILAAREAIEGVNIEANPLAAMALAETFDPNMLAAWSIRGAHADVERARHLYQRAFSSGVMKARQRLEALE
jgi:hypothetical protein